jgi:hypothetical protein
VGSAPSCGRAPAVAEVAELRRARPTQQSKLESIARRCSALLFGAALIHDAATWAGTSTTTSTSLVSPSLCLPASHRDL